MVSVPHSSAMAPLARTMFIVTQINWSQWFDNYSASWIYWIRSFKRFIKGRFDLNDFRRDWIVLIVVMLFLTFCMWVCLFIGVLVYYTYKIVTNNIVRINKRQVIDTIVGFPQITDCNLWGLLSLLFIALSFVFQIISLHFTINLRIIKFTHVNLLLILTYDYYRYCF